MTNSTNPTSAESIEEMRQVARNQIQAKIYELEERIVNLQRLIPQVDSVNDDNYSRIISEVNYSGDADDLTALSELGNYYQTMMEGGYF